MFSEIGNGKQMKKLNNIKSVDKFFSGLETNKYIKKLDVDFSVSLI